MTVHHHDMAACLHASRRVVCRLRALLNALHGQEAVEVEPTNLRVVFKAARLERTCQLAESGINDGDVVHLVRPKRGWIYLAAHGSVLEVTATSIHALEVLGSAQSQIIGRSGVPDQVGPG